MANYYQRINELTADELQTAVLALIREWDSEAVAGVDYRQLTTVDAQAYIDTWLNCSVTDIANELMLADDDDADEDWGHSDNWGDEYDGQPDEAQEWHDFDPDC